MYETLKKGPTLTHSRNVNINKGRTPAAGPPWVLHSAATGLRPQPQAIDPSLGHTLKTLTCSIVIPGDWATSTGTGGSEGPVASGLHARTHAQPRKQNHTEWRCCDAILLRASEQLQDGCTATHPFSPLAMSTVIHGCRISLQFSYGLLAATRALLSARTAIHTLFAVPITVIGIELRNVASTVTKPQ